MTATEDHLAAMALSVARCNELPLAETNNKHPCAKVVAVQTGKGGLRQVPEPWAGNLRNGRILFISSNPSLSEAGDHQSGDFVERYPLVEWSDDEMANFFLHRFGTDQDSPATPKGHFRRTDGQLSPRKVAFWVRVGKRAAELLGSDASPEHDYCMTEVVHCKSKREKGVSQAASHCATLHLDRVVAASPAALIVVLGGASRNHLVPLWDLPAGFGTRGSLANDPTQSLAIRQLGGAERLVAYLPHPTGMEPLRSFDDVYLKRGLDLRPVVREEVAPAEWLLGSRVT